MNFRIGQGFDVHAVKKGNEVILGGCKIPAQFSLEGHSDADVLLHAITDAFLGSIAEKDIGEFFPPNLEENKNRNSADFLIFAHDLILKQNYQLANIDCTIICEHPKITPYKEKIRKNIAMLLKIESSQISVKATTTEKLGFTGRQEGIASQAIVLIERK